MVRRPAFLALLFTLLWSTAWAQDPVGTEFQVNTVTRLDQRRSAVAADEVGNFVVVWSSYEQDGDSYGIFGQRFNGAGLRVGAEFQVNSYSAGAQSFPAAALDTAGRLVVAWRSRDQDGSHYGAFARRYDAFGTPGAEFQLNTYADGFQGDPAPAFLGNGRFVVAWNSEGQDGGGFGVFARRYDTSGTPEGAEFRVNAFTTGYQIDPAVAAAADGAFVVVWSSYGQDGDTYGVFGQRYDASGTARGSEFRVNAYTTGYQVDPGVAAAADGGFVVVWSSYGQEAFGWSVFGQRFDAAGLSLGTEFRVNLLPQSVEPFPSVSSAATGDFVVAWQSFGVDGSGRGVFGQRFDRAGLKRGGEFRVNTYTTGHQAEAAVASAWNGNFVVTWTSVGQDGDLEGVFGQRYGDLIFGDGFE
jgi:hypothetical protein